MHVGLDGKITYSQGTGTRGQNLAMSQRQSGAVRTAPQSTFSQVQAQQYQQSQDTRAQQALWNSLPTHVKNKIQSKGYQIDAEYSVGLNNALTPESQTKYGIMYSVACRSAKLPGKIIYLPYYETYPNNPRTQVQVRIISESSAATQQAQDTGPYRAELNRFPTHTYGINAGKYGRYEIDNKGRVSVDTKYGSYKRTQSGNKTYRIKVPNTR